MKQQVFISTQRDGLLESGEFCKDTQEGIFERIQRLNRERELREKLEQELGNNAEPLPRMANEDERDEQ